MIRLNQVRNTRFQTELRLVFVAKAKSLAAEPRRPQRGAEQFFAISRLNFDGRRLSLAKPE